MATPSKKAVAKVPAKKTAFPAALKPAKVAGVKKPAVKFVSFEFGATIPTGSFGNIKPSIVVEAASYEDAAAYAIPKIEDLYRKYSEVKPTFLGKITETVREVVPVKAAAELKKGDLVQEAPAAPTQSQATDTPAPVAQDVPAPQATATAAVEAPKSEFAARAEKMIGLALTEEAAVKIKEQIEKSEKIPAEEKPALLTLVEAKITDFQTNIW